MRSINYWMTNLLWLLLLTATTSAQSVDKPSTAQASSITSSDLKAAAQRAIKIVELSSAEYLKQRECFSCHHQAMSIFALMEARTRGLTFDMPNLHQQVRRTLEHLERGQPTIDKAKAKVAEWILRVTRCPRSALRAYLAMALPMLWLTICWKSIALKNIGHVPAIDRRRSRAISRRRPWPCADWPPISMRKMNRQQRAHASSIVRLGTVAEAHRRLRSVAQ